MVLQHDMAVPVWGGIADYEKGKWLVKLDPLKVGDPLLAARMG